MQVLAQVEFAAGYEGRRVARHRANTMATARQMKQPNVMIHVVDISCEGCGFRSQRPFTVGARVWLGLPGIETWPSTVVWWQDGKGGLKFERPLQPVVAEGFATRIARDGR
jgi:hypothetical protein